MKYEYGTKTIFLNLVEIEYDQLVWMSNFDEELSWQNVIFENDKLFVIENNMFFMQNSYISIDIRMTITN